MPFAIAIITVWTAGREAAGQSGRPAGRQLRQSIKMRHSHFVVDGGIFQAIFLLSSPLTLGSRPAAREEKQSRE